MTSSSPTTDPSISSIESLDSTLAEISELYATDRLHQAYLRLRDAVSATATTEIDVEKMWQTKCVGLPPNRRQMIEDILFSHSILSYILKSPQHHDAADGATTAAAATAPTTAPVTSAHSDDILVNYIKDSSSGRHIIRIQGDIDAPILSVLSLIYEIDLYRLWVPHMTDCQILTRNIDESLYRFTCYFRWNLIWPMYDRDCVTRGIGVDMLDEERAILVAIKSVSLDDESMISNKNDRVCRMTCDRAGFWIQWLPEQQRTRIIILSQVDPQLAFVPAWLQDKVTSWAAPHVIRMLRKYANEMEHYEEYVAARRKNAHVYEDITRRLKL